MNRAERLGIPAQIAVAALVPLLGVLLWRR